MKIRSYPTKKVILTYSLLGGLVGGLIYALFVGVLLLIDLFRYQAFRFDLIAIFDFFTAFAVMLIISLIIGLLPALITATVIALKRITIINFESYLKLGVIGFLATLPFSLVIIMFMVNWSNGLSGFNLDFHDSVAIWGINLIGGLSSVILGNFVLPKAKS